MNDSAPPPPAAPRRAVSAPGPAPHSWQDPTGAPYSHSLQAPAFDPRRAVGGAGVNASRQGTNPILAPPPMRSSGLGRGAPSPYAAPAVYEEPAFPGPPPHNAQPAYAAQTPGPNAYPGLPDPGHGYAPAAYDHNYAAPPPVYDYPQSGLPVEPAGGRASLLSKLTGRAKKDRSQKDQPAAGPDPYSPAAHSPAAQWHDHSAPMDPALAPAPAAYQDQARDPAKQAARKPFFMGLLTGVVVMLILGQVFRAASPSDDYAQALPPINMTVTDGPVSDDPEVLAFLDTVEGLN